MNRIDRTFRKLKNERRKAFIAYITAGDPDMRVTKELVPALEKAGVDIIELGIPFSDPLADGPTIQAASHRALSKGTTLEKIFDAIGSIRKVTEIPIVFMTYYNPVLKYGLKRFMADCARDGVDGVVIPDLPLEESGELRRHARASGVSSIFLVAPTSTRERIKSITALSTGFVYYVSLTGVTGARRELPPELISRIKLVKSMTKRPVAVGFGVADAGQAGRVAKVADAVIVGSRIVRIIEANRKDKKAIISKVSRFSRGLAEAIHGA